MIASPLGRRQGRSLRRSPLRLWFIYLKIAVTRRRGTIAIQAESIICWDGDRLTRRTFNKYADSLCLRNAP
ncbi:MAG: hypothetical protein PUP93_13465 [Rhizonema sp. NSF051]|nr:hypothetical protein [Rhizonema sp. NSF051]